MKRSALICASAAAVLCIGTPAQASPPQAPIDANDSVWGCAGDPGVALPPAHCINLKSKGNTGVIKVFEPDARWPVEGVSTDPKSDSRPCPHDPGSPDGTWWSPVPGLWVCHHKP